MSEKPKSGLADAEDVDEIGSTEKEGRQDQRQAGYGSRRWRMNMILRCLMYRKPVQLVVGKVRVRTETGCQIREVRRFGMFVHGAGCLNNLKMGKR